MCSFYRDASGIEGQAIERVEKFAKIFVIVCDITWRQNIQPEDFKDGIIFMSMSNAEKIQNYAMRFLQGQWTFLGQG